MESFNKTLINTLKKAIAQSQRDWHLQLPSTLWAYYTSVRSTMGMTLFSLVYGTEPVLLLEVEIPSLHVSLRGLVDEELICQAHVFDVKALDERHLTAYKANLASKACSQRTYDKHLRSHPLFPRDHILKLEYLHDRLAKFKPRWVGPFVIIESLSNNAYRIATLEGLEFEKTVNEKFLKKFYS